MGQWGSECTGIVVFKEESTNELQTMVLWVMTPCSRIGGYQHVRLIRYHLQFRNEVLVTTFQTAQCLNLEDQNLNLHCHENLKSQTLWTSRINGFSPLLVILNSTLFQKLDLFPSSCPVTGISFL
jgi:hypothetical protein